jgi:hypothetical protein
MTVLKKAQTGEMGMDFANTPFLPLLSAGGCFF